LLTVSSRYQCENDCSTVSLRGEAGKQQAEGARLGMTDDVGFQEI